MHRVQFCIGKTHWIAFAGFLLDHNRAWPMLALGHSLLGAGRRSCGYCSSLDRAENSTGSADCSTGRGWVWPEVALIDFRLDQTPFQVAVLLLCPSSSSSSCRPSTWSRASRVATILCLAESRARPAEHSACYCLGQAGYEDGDWNQRQGERSMDFLAFLLLFVLSAVVVVVC